MSIAPGTAALSLTSREKNQVSGFHPSFQGVFEVNKLTGTATAELSLPITLEFGVDLLSGTFRATAKLINAPSAYVTAGYTKDNTCKGVEFRAGMKNRMYSAAFERWEYEFRTDILYDVGLGCVTYDPSPSFFFLL